MRVQFFNGKFIKNYAVELRPDFNKKIIMKKRNFGEIYAELVLPAFLSVIILLLFLFYYFFIETDYNIPIQVKFITKQNFHFLLYILLKKTK